MKFVAVSATAAPGYVRPVDARGKPLPESYVFAEGRFWGGDTADTRLEQVKFGDIAKMLAVNLAKQNYFPTKSPPTANLLLAVHWGVTSVYRDPMRDITLDRLNEALATYNASAAANGAEADPGALNAALADQGKAQTSAQGAVARNAALLGFRAALEKERRKPWVSADEQSMAEELNEERYFIIVMAFDYQELQKAHKKHLLWVTRISVGSPGNNFTEAMPAIAQAGAEVYGRQIEDLVRVNVPGHVGRVDFGELKVLGTVEDPSPEKAKR